MGGRYGFLIVSVLKAQRQKKKRTGYDEEDRMRQRSAELVLEVWCQMAERARTLGRYLIGCDKEFHRRMMELFDGYHYNPRNNFSLMSTRVKIISEGAFGIIDIMQDDDWQVVQRVLGYWVQTMHMRTAQWLCAGGGKLLGTERYGPRRQDPHWLRKRKSTTLQECFV